MSYKLKFLSSTLKEWKKLDKSIQKHLKKKLNERLIKPDLPSSRLHGFDNHYKIKLKASGYHLVYEIINDEFYVLVIAIGKRYKKMAYKQARTRTKKNG